LRWTPFSMPADCERNHSASGRDWGPSLTSCKHSGPHDAGSSGPSAPRSCRTWSLSTPH